MKHRPFKGHNTVMNRNRSQLLRTPQGTESIILEEAYRHRQLLRMTEDHFSSWGYLPVHTPVFDYFETYRPLLSRSQVEKSYRFPDRNGELLMLRSDITLFLAKQMGLSLREAELPRRVYYADSILRHQEEEDISSDEFFQSGAELIGSPGQAGDLEVLMLLHDLLSEMDIARWKMHIGSRKILDAVLEGRGSPEKAGSFLERRDGSAFRNHLEEQGIERAREKTELMFFIGTIEEFQNSRDALTAACGAWGSTATSTATGAATSTATSAATSTEGSALSQAVRELSLLTEELSRTAGTENIRIDLSEHGGQPYYTGFTVKVYAEGANTAIATGGRYDELLGCFGSKTPAAGFSLMMRKIEPVSRFASLAAGENPVSPAEGKNFQERYANARGRRENGERVVMQ